MSRIERREVIRGEDRWHTYHLDGVKVPGVTTAMNVMSKGDALTWWSAREAGKYAWTNRTWWTELDEDAAVLLAAKAHDTARREAAARGTKTHDLVVPLLRGEGIPTPTDPRLYGLTEAALRFINEWRFTPMVTEAVVYSETHRYAGTLDLVGTSPLYPGRVFLADWKTNRKAIYPEVALQLAAYANAEYYVDENLQEQPMRDLGITDHIALWLHDDGTYTVQATTTEPGAFEEFLAALNLYTIKARVHRHLLGEELGAPEAVAS